jgi:hypothetical protein
VGKGSQEVGVAGWLGAAHACLRLLRHGPDIRASARAKQARLADATVGAGVDPTSWPSPVG